MTLQRLLQRSVEYIDSNSNPWLRGVVADVWPRVQLFYLLAVIKESEAIDGHKRRAEEKHIWIENLRNGERKIKQKSDQIKRRS